MSKDRDSELDELLQPLREMPKDDLLIRRWQKVVRRELRRQIAGQPVKVWLQILSAGLVGFVLGAAAFRTPMPRVDSFTSQSEFVDDAATVSYFYVNAK
jgi:hypothetical protein